MTGSFAYQEILFFDSFKHDQSDTSNLDQIKFTYPVYIDEIRVIPGGCDVSLANNVNFHGETSPNSFKLEIFGNDLNKKLHEKATFDRIANLFYRQDEEDILVKPKSIPTDWIVLRGSYTSITVAIIGVKAKPTEQDMQQMATPWLNQKNDFTQGSPQVHIGHFTAPRPLMHVPPPSLLSPQINGAPFNGNASQMQRPPMPLNIPIPQPLMLPTLATAPNLQPGIKPLQNDRPQQHPQQSTLTAPAVPLVTSLRHCQSLNIIHTKEFNETRLANDQTAINRTHSISISSTASNDLNNSGVGKRLNNKKPNFYTDDDGETKADGNDNGNDNNDEDNETNDDEEDDTDDDLLIGGCGETDDDTDEDFYGDELLNDFHLYYDQDDELDDNNNNTLDIFKTSDVSDLSLQQKPHVNPALNKFESKLRAGDVNTDTVNEMSDVFLKFLLDHAKADTHKEDWLGKCEEYFGNVDTLTDILAHVKLAKPTKFSSITATLIDWSIECIDLYEALSTRSKHLAKRFNFYKQFKLGVNLCGLLVSGLDEATCEAFLNKYQLQAKLMTLFDLKYVYTPVKLLLLKILDSSLHFTIGIHTFLGINNAKSKSETPFQRLIQTFLKSRQAQHTRTIQNEIVKLICKIKFYEILIKFSTSVQQLIGSTEYQCKLNSSTEQQINEQVQFLHEANDSFAVFQFYLANFKKISIKQFKLKNIPVFKFLQQSSLVTDLDEAYLLNEFYQQNYKKSLLRMLTNAQTLKYVALLWLHPLTPQARLDLYENLENFLLTFFNSNLMFNFLMSHLSLCKFLAKTTIKNANIEGDLCPTPDTSSSSSQLQFTFSSALQILDSLNSLNEMTNSFNKNEMRAYLTLINQLQLLNTHFINPTSRFIFVKILCLNKKFSIILSLFEKIFGHSDDMEMNGSELDDDCVEAKPDEMDRSIADDFKETATSPQQDAPKPLMEGSIKLPQALMATQVVPSTNLIQSPTTPKKSASPISECKHLVLTNFIEIFHSFLTHNNDCVGFMKLHSVRLGDALKLINTNKESKIIQKKVKAINEYLEPCLKVKSYHTTDCLNFAIERLNTYENTVQTLPKSLITVLRILNSYYQDEYTDDQDDEIQRKILTNDLLNINLIKILIKLSDNLLKFLQFYYSYKIYINLTIQQQITIDRHNLNSTLKLFINLFRNLIIIIKFDKYCNYDGQLFKNLFNFYNFVTSYTSSSQKEMQQLKLDVLEVFVLFTQITTSPRQSVVVGSVVTTTAYTSLFKELIKYTFDLPQNYLCGLSIFGELLPLPLPIVCKSELTSQYVDQLVSKRKYLCDTLYQVSNNLRKFIRVFALSTNYQLLQSLKRVCIQLSDLSRAMCLLVLRTCLDCLLDFIKNEAFFLNGIYGELQNPNNIILTNETEIEAPIWPIEISRLLNFLTTLLNNQINNMFKYGLLYILNNQSNTDEKYRYLIRVLINYYQIRPKSQQAQQQHEQLSTIYESIFYFVQILTELTIEPFIQTHFKSNKNEIYLNYLPNFGYLEQIINFSLDYISVLNECEDLSLNEYVFNIILQLLRFDYTFELFIFELINKFKNSCIVLHMFIKSYLCLLKDKQQAIDLCGLFNEILNLILYQPTINGNVTAEQDDVQHQQRKSHISIYRFKCLLKWTDVDHVLSELDVYLQETFSNSCLKSLVEKLSSKNENLAERFSYFNLNKFLFEKIQRDGDETDRVFDQLEFYFAKRPVYVIDELNCAVDIDRYETEWFSSDDATVCQQSEEVDEVNLNEYFDDGFNVDDELSREFANLISKKTCDEKSSDKLKKKKLKKNEIINTRTGFRYKAPMRGGHSNPARGGGGRFSGPSGMDGGFQYSINRNDPFRSRQPNTSRPPSVHVDDFYRLKNQGQKHDEFQDQNRHIREEWNRRQFQSQMIHSQMSMSSMQPRPRFMLPYSMSNRMQSGEFLAPLPPPQQGSVQQQNTNQQMQMQMHQRFPQRLPMGQFNQDQQKKMDELLRPQMTNQPLLPQPPTQQQQQNPRFQFQNNFLMRPGFRGAGLFNGARRMPQNNNIRQYQQH